MNNYRVAILAVIILIILFAGAYFIYQKQTGNIPTFEANPSASPESLITLPSPTPAPQSSAGPQVNEQPQSGSDTVEVKNIGIKVDQPEGSSIISSPLTVSGSANVFEGKIIINVLDSAGHVLGSSQTTACMGYDACPFQTSINFASPLTQAGTIEIYNPSGVDGSPHYLQSILVRF